MSEMQIIEPGSISEMIWRDKYRWVPAGDEARGDRSIADTFARVANALAVAEKESSIWAERFFSIMRSFEFLPAGRIIAGAGTGRDVTMSNCFVMPQIGDSMAGIMQAVTEAAMTLRTGGGVGMDFSTIRPRGARVKGLDAEASGPVSFMDLWNSMCGTIMSAGARRGAMMGVLRCDHPDVEEFITAKRTPGRLTNFNISVAVTDAFMVAVKADSDWPLVFGGKVYKTVRARHLWDTIIRSTYDHAEPGVLFIDRINAANPLSYAEHLYTTNPCGEQPLPPGGACLLGSINLTQFVISPFRQPRIDLDRLESVTRVAVRMMDNVNDISRYPLPIQKAEAQNKRRIGLGITGLADALIMYGIRYGSEEAVHWLREVLSSISGAASDASIALGHEKGSFPLFDASRFPGRSSARRNSHLTSIAPTGTISLLAGNISSGIEPVFAWSYRRNVLQPDGSKKLIDCDDYVVRLAKHLNEPMKTNEWVRADDLTVDDHLAMVAAAQPYIDSAISKTINCPADMPFDQFESVYLMAYELGLKGCTTYRPTPDRGAVLVRTDEPAKVEAPAVVPAASNVVQIGEPLERPEMVKGRTYKLKPSGAEHAHYVTINDIEQHGRRRPLEIFINTKEVDGAEWKVALARTISAVFRKGGDVAFLADELRQVHAPRGGFFSGGSYVPSMCSAIGGIIDRHLRETGHSVVDGAVPASAPVAAKHCPKCQTGRLVMQEGCWNCDDCGYSKCG